MTQLHLRKSGARVAAGTALLLLVPLVAMQFTNEVAWGVGDFVAAAALLFGSGMAYALAARRARNTWHRVAVGALTLAVLAVVWAELAVGVIS